MQILFNILNNYDARNPIKVRSKNGVFENAKRLYSIRNEIIDGFKDGTFLMSKESVSSDKT